VKSSEILKTKNGCLYAHPITKWRIQSLARKSRQGKNIRKKKPSIFASAF